MPECRNYTSASQKIVKPNLRIVTVSEFSFYLGKKIASVVKSSITATFVLDFNINARLSFPGMLVI